VDVLAEVEVMVTLDGSITESVSEAMVINVKIDASWIDGYGKEKLQCESLVEIDLSNAEDSLQFIQIFDIQSLTLKHARFIYIYFLCLFSYKIHLHCLTCS
jgi:hypothetical protein